MKILSLSTAEQGCSLAIADKSSLLYEEYWTNKKTHSLRLFKMIAHAMENRVNLTLKDIDLFVVAKGPGSFTGLRIGISVIKGLGHAMDRPVRGISSLDGIAFRFYSSFVPVFAMMDARRGEVYCALYHFHNGRLISKSPEQALKPEQAVETVKKESVLFAGTGAKLYQDIIMEKAKKPLFSYNLYDSVNAAALIQSFHSGHSDHSADSSLHPQDSMVPNYIRKSDAELNRA